MPELEEGNDGVIRLTGLGDSPDPAAPMGTPQPRAVKLRKVKSLAECENDPSAYTAQTEFDGEAHFIVEMDEDKGEPAAFEAEERRIGKALEAISKVLSPDDEDDDEAEPEDAAPVDTSPEASNALKMQRMALYRAVVVKHVRGWGKPVLRSDAEKSKMSPANLAALARRVFQKSSFGTDEGDYLKLRSGRKR